MPKNNQPYPQEVRSENNRVSKAGGDQTAPTSPFNYSIDEEAEREKAMNRATDKVVNNPMRPIL